MERLKRRMIDQAVNLVKTDSSEDNPLWRNIILASAELKAQGVAPLEAERLASVRLFSVPSGVYGTGLEQAIHHPDTGNDKHDVPTVYFNRMSHLFGQGFWSTRARGGTNDAKWQEMFEVYVQDRNQLDILEKFKAAENLAAYKAIVDRMLTVVDKDYWKPSPETLVELRRLQADLTPSVAAENATIARRADLQPAPVKSSTLAANTTAPSAMKPPHIVVKGRVLEEKARTPSRFAAPTTWLPRMAHVGLAALLLVALGWWRAGCVPSSNAPASRSNAISPDAP